MTLKAFAATAIVALLTQGAVYGSAPGVASAAEIKAIVAGGITPVVTALTAEFERTSGHKLVFTFVSGPVVQREIEKGTPFDVAISQPEVIESLIKSGKVAAGSRADIARTGVGVSVRAGAPKPDISTVDAFRQTLLKAKSIAHSKEGASGVYFMGLLDRLGIATEVKPKLIGAPAGPGGLVSPVLKGEAEMVVGTASAIMEDGVALVGPIPNELQHWTTFTAGIASASTDAAAAQALVRFLTAPGAVAAIKAKGMEPLGR